MSWPELAPSAASTPRRSTIATHQFPGGPEQDGLPGFRHDQSMSRPTVLPKKADEQYLGRDHAEASKTQYMPAKLDWLLEKRQPTHVIVFDPA